jgi:hypothetical protein
VSTEKYNTNLAAEYRVLSVLHRLGAEANLTLGNKKWVDVVVVRDAGGAPTVDVKGLAGTTSWPVDNVKMGRQNHFLVFVCFLGKIGDLTVVPSVATPGAAQNLFYRVWWRTGLRVFPKQLL